MCAAHVLCNWRTCVHWVDLAVFGQSYSAASVLTDVAAAPSVERPLRSGLEPGERAVRELVDRVHVGQDRAIMRHHDGALIL